MESNNLVPSATADADVILSRVIFICLAALLLLGLVAFWVAPAYENRVWFAFGAFTNALSAALGAKYGMAIPGGSKPPPKGP
jgi:hypothetical protein